MAIDGALLTSDGPHDFARVYEAEGRRLWRAIFAFAADREIASDAVAEAFAQCIRRGDSVQNPAAWIWRAAFRIAAGELNRRKLETALEDNRSYEMADPPWRLIAVLASLPLRQRAALVLHHYAGYPTSEIAATLGCNTATVRVHLSRGKKKLRKLLEERDD